ncbi:hypothetical protein V5O48_011289 [Marasmius crinis-equi]|uniref:Uncharacterized protein n=1 Tax=Marasmius crinis-equi TaxID=585013 RepID=A0ABR3F606_9AGAR
MQDYQILRGFDPTTSDFAQHCGYNDVEFEPVRPSPTIPTTSERFEELDNSASVRVEPEDGITDNLESVYTSLPALFGDLSVEDDTSTAHTPGSAESSIGATTNVWSRLTSSFSWTASEDSDILAMAF